MKALFTLFSAMLLFVSVGAKTITGTVSDQNGESIPFVQVLIKDTKKGTQTDKNGKYSIEAHTGDTLVFSMVGYTKVEKEVGKKKVINVMMNSSEVELFEVVVEDMEVRAKSYNLSGIRHQGRPWPKNQTESYKEINENIFKSVTTSPLSTFSIDVDNASYSNVRRMINMGQEIPKDAVKIEEMVNYFTYEYPQPEAEHPFSIHTETAQTPWNDDTKLVKIGLQGKNVPVKDIPPSNLVFLIDVSGSMNAANKLPLLKSAFKLLTNQLREEDKVSIVVYAGAPGMVLEPTNGNNKTKILDAINKLSAGGSTAGGEGIKLAYKTAQEQFIDGGNNRVILATDGDFNVGASSDRAMRDLIEEKRESGVFLTCLGFGMGNYKDSKMETLADKGNGNHGYIDSMQEARKILGTEFGGTLYTIAKDVKIQVEFNPAAVQAYRLIGYENRLLNDEDFNDDTKDAGELGSGHSVTAMYEVIPVGVKSPYLNDIDSLKYTHTSQAGKDDELLTVKFRYKNPDGNTSKLLSHTAKNEFVSQDEMSVDFKFASAVALFGMQLRESEFNNNASPELVKELANAGRGTDREGYRAEFIRLAESVQ